MFSLFHGAILAALLAQGLAAPLIETPLSLRDSQDTTLQPRAKTSFSVTATGQTYYNSGWMIPLQLGNQSIQIRMDTGSSTFWILSNLLPQDQWGANHAIYTPSSSASQVQGETYIITYADGSGSKGLVYADTVVAGSATITSQAVGAASSVSSVQNTPNSGLLGLSYGAVQGGMSPVAQNTLAKNLMSQLIDPVMAMDLNNGAAGSVSFGALDTTRFTGSVAWVPRQTTTSSRWDVQVSGFYVAGTLIQNQPSAIALVDTGTTLIRMPQAIVDTYYLSVPGAAAIDNSYIFPCSNIQNHIMPSFGFQLGNRVATVPGDYMFYAPVNRTHCRGALQPSSGTNYLGDMFLRTQYVVFNYTVPGYVGFATKANLQPPPAL